MYRSMCIFLSNCQFRYLSTLPMYRTAEHPSYLCQLPYVPTLPRYRPAKASFYLSLIHPYYSHYLLTDLPNNLHIYLLACLPTYLHYLCTDLPNHLPIYLSACLPTYITCIQQLSHIHSIMYLNVLDRLAIFTQIRFKEISMEWNEM